MTISDFESHRRENAARREAENHREAAWGRGVEKRLRIIASLQEELGRQRKEQEKTDEDQRQQESMLSRRCPLRYLPIPDTRYSILDTRRRPLRPPPTQTTSSSSSSSLSSSDAPRHPPSYLGAEGAGRTHGRARARPSRCSVVAAGAARRRRGGSRKSVGGAAKAPKSER